MSKKRKYPEERAQREVVKWLRKRPDWMVIRCENAAKRNMAQMARDTAMGMLGGAPDLVLLYKRRVIWLEMKAEKGHLSDEQINVHAQLKARGQVVFVAFGDIQAIAMLESIEYAESTAPL